MKLFCFIVSMCCINISVAMDQKTAAITFLQQPKSPGTPNPLVATTRSYPQQELSGTMVELGDVERIEELQGDEGAVHMEEVPLNPQPVDSMLERLEQDRRRKILCRIVGYGALIAMAGAGGLLALLNYLR